MGTLWYMLRHTPMRDIIVRPAFRPLLMYMGLTCCVHTSRCKSPSLVETDDLVKKEEDGADGADDAEL